MMTSEQLPRKVEDSEPKHVLRGYFHIRSQKKEVIKSITVYQDVAERFGEQVGTEGLA